MTQTGLLQIIFFVASAFLSYGLAVGADMVGVAPSAGLPFVGAMLAAVLVSALFARLNGRNQTTCERRHFAMVATVVLGLASLAFLWLYMHAGGPNEFSLIAAETSLGTVTWLTTLIFMFALVAQYISIRIGLRIGLRQVASAQQT